MEMKQELLIAISVIAITLIFVLVLFTFFLKYLANKRETLLDKEIAVYNEQLRRKISTIEKKYKKLVQKNKNERTKTKNYQNKLSNTKKELAYLKASHISDSQPNGTTFEHSKIYLKRGLKSLSHEIYSNFLVNLNDRMMDIPQTISQEIDVLFHETIIRKCHEFPEILKITAEWSKSDQLLIEEDLKRIKVVLSTPEIKRSMRYLEDKDEYIKLILYTLKEVKVQQKTVELLIYMCNTYTFDRLLNFISSFIDVIAYLTAENVVQVQVSNAQLEAEFFSCIKRMRYEKYLVFSVSQSEIEYGIAANYQGKVIATSLFTLFDDYMDNLERIY